MAEVNTLACTVVANMAKSAPPMTRMSLNFCFFSIEYNLLIFFSQKKMNNDMTLSFCTYCMWENHKLKIYYAEKNQKTQTNCEYFDETFCVKSFFIILFYSYLCVKKWKMKIKWSKIHGNLYFEEIDGMYMKCWEKHVFFEKH